MIVHRLLDAFFRTLDAVDAARERVDRVLGRAPRPDPWAVEWPTVDDEIARPGAPSTPPAAREEPRAPSTTRAPVKEPDRAPTPAEAKPSKRPSSKPAAGSARASKKKVGRKKSETANRKGSVDRVGKDLDSPRARAIHNRIAERGLPVVTEDADYAGKKVLGRTLWALAAAEDAGAEKGLTTNDVSALLHLAAGIEVFATNIGRACRDHADLISESEPDGRTRRFRLTEAGRNAAKGVATTR